MDDPQLSVKALMQDTQEEIRCADMFKMFNSGMEQLGDADSALYAEPMSMAQVYDMMYVGACYIGAPATSLTQNQTRDEQRVQTGKVGAYSEDT